MEAPTETNSERVIQVALHLPVQWRDRHETATTIEGKNWQLSSAVKIDQGFKNCPLLLLKHKRTTWSWIQLIVWSWHDWAALKTFIQPERKNPTIFEFMSHVSRFLVWDIVTHIAPERWLMMPVSWMQGFIYSIKTHRLNSRTPSRTIDEYRSLKTCCVSRTGNAFRVSCFFQKEQELEKKRDYKWTGGEKAKISEHFHMRRRNQSRKWEEGKKWFKEEKKNERRNP